LKMLAKGGSRLHTKMGRKYHRPELRRSIAASSLYVYRRLSTLNWPRLPAGKV